jgi:hypothetical protein
MTEKLSNSSEKGVESIDTTEELKRSRERLKNAESQENHSNGHEEQLTQLSQKAEKEAVSGKDVSMGETKEGSVQSAPGTQKQLKNLAYKRSLERIRSQLPAPQRLFSKISHQPIIDKAGEVGSRTIARPSGILGGGTVTLIGSGFLLYMAKRYGFEYNLTAFILFFIGGFFLGLVIELALRLIRRSKAD